MNYVITKPNRRVRKSNALINAKEKVSLSAMEQKLILFAITELDGENPSKPLQIEFQDFFGQQKLRSSQYRDLRKACKAVASAMVAFEEEDSEGEVVLGHYVPVFAEIVADNNKGELTFEFNQRIMSHITDLKKNFTSYLYRNISDLKSGHAIKIYELLVQGVGHYSHREFRLDELKEILGLTGTKTYQHFGRFRQNVLDKACTEITEKTDIDVSWEIAEKKLRRVTAVRFQMSEKQPMEKVTATEKKTTPPVENKPRQLTLADIDKASPIKSDDFTFESEKHYRLYKRMTELGLSKEQAIKVVNKVGVSRDSGIWVLINELKMGIKDGKIINAKSYTLKLLQEKYGLKL
ncbi:replication initiation protein [Limibacter armeniacum]|uniref:replication initiation protein n=1 Tax=Limibacter armeniacum TaxID=466084 RepID=UPI002FE61B97